MQIENSLTIDAPPDRVYEFLLDVNRVVGCVPGAQLSEIVDAVLYLESASFVTGEICHVDGGEAAGVG